jgi:hypothetical protein
MVTVSEITVPAVVARARSTPTVVRLNKTSASEIYARTAKRVIGS